MVRAFGNPSPSMFVHLHAPATPRRANVVCFRSTKPGEKFGLTGATCWSRGFDFRCRTRFSNEAKKSRELAGNSIARKRAMPMGDGPPINKKKTFRAGPAGPPPPPPQTARTFAEERKKTN